MAKFHFFTEVDLLHEQQQDWAFGPFAADPSNQFLVTSKHYAAAPIKSFAVCDGIVLVQDAGIGTGGQDVVNLILKPTQQPPFAFPKIKYFIYRGILKSELVDNTDPTKIAGNNTNDIKNDLTKSIWDSQTARNASVGTTDDAPADALGINYMLADGDPIESAFYRDNEDFQLPFVKGGWHIGNFDENEFGFEIIVESVGFDPSLALVRNHENIIDVTAFSNPQTPAADFEYWHEKEVILNYIDPCAFFGNFYNFKIKCTKNSGGIVTFTGNEVYDEILQGAQFSGSPVGGPPGIFFNKNRIYLDIRNEYNHSINYFKNYGKDIQIVLDTVNTLSNINYYESEWPLRIIESNLFDPGNTTAPLTIRIALPDGGGDNPCPTLYVSCGYLNDTYPKEPKEQAKLVDMIYTGANTFTDDVALNSPNRTGEPTTIPISSYIKLKYFKRFDSNATSPPVSSGTVIRASNYLDNLFAPFDMKIPFAGTAKIKSVVYDEEVFVDAKLEMNKQCILSVGISDDSNNISAFSFMRISIEADSYDKHTAFTIFGEKIDISNDFLKYIESKYLHLKLNKGNLNISGSNLPYLIFNNVVPYYQASMSNKSPDDFFSIVITKSEYSDLINIKNDPTKFNNKFRIYVGTNQKLSLLDDNLNPYIRIDLTLRGFKLLDQSLPTERYEVVEEIVNLNIFCNGNF